MCVRITGPAAAECLFVQRVKVYLQAADRNANEPNYGEAWFFFFDGRVWLVHCHVFFLVFLRVHGSIGEMYLSENIVRWRESSAFTLSNYYIE